MFKKIIFTASILLCFATTNSFSQEIKKQDTIVIKTSSICETCKKTLEKSMAFEKGVKSSNLNIDTKELTVIYNPKKTNPDKIKKAVTLTGYDADSLPADPKAYQNLNDCCKKENSHHQK